MQQSNYQQSEKPPKELEKTFANNNLIFDKKLISEIYKDLHNPIIKKKTTNNAKLQIT